MPSLRRRREEREHDAKGGIHRMDMRADWQRMTFGERRGIRCGATERYI